MEGWVTRANTLHNSKYTYIDSFMKKGKEHIKITCPIHGDFEQRKDTHLTGRGCAKCGRAEGARKTRWNLQLFVAKANVLHDSKYIYHKAVYINISTHLTITCPTHGEFSQTPSNHLQGHGCTKCGRRMRLTLNEFIERSNIVHNFKYTYKDTKFIDVQTKVIIECPLHGKFTQIPNSHLCGRGCLICGGRSKLTLDTFVTRANKAHNFKYSYKKAVYVNAKTKLLIICPKHGEYLQVPDNHLKGHGCDKCARDTVAYDSYKDKPTTLYIVDFGMYNGVPIIKIGLTQSTISTRFNKEFVKPKSLYEVKYRDGFEAYVKEQKLLKLTEPYKIPTETSNKLLHNNAGHTELRHKDALSIIERYI